MRSFVDSIQKYSVLSPQEVAALNALPNQIVRVAPNAPIVTENEPSRFYHVLTDGFAACSRMLPGNRRQIIAFLVSGDACDLHAVSGGRTLHSVTALMPCTVTRLPIPEVLALIETSPRIAHAFWLDAIGQSSVLAEWIANVGRRTGAERVAHLICEIFTRLRRIGLARPQGFEWPVTQVQLGDATGLSTVHVNRILRDLKTTNLLTLYGNSVVIENFAALKAFCGFDETYLNPIPDLAASRA